MIPTDAHDHDTDDPPECPCCSELAPCLDEHVCAAMAWVQWIETMCDLIIEAMKSGRTSL